MRCVLDCVLRMEARNRVRIGRRGRGGIGARSETFRCRGGFFRSTILRLVAHRLLSSKGGGRSCS